MPPREAPTDPLLRAPVEAATELTLQGAFALDALNTARLRFRAINPKEAFTVRDAAGTWFRASLVAYDPAGASALAYEQLRQSPESPLAITLVNAVPQRQRMLWVVQKAAELGVAAIAPVFTERSVQADGLAHEKAHAWPGQALKGTRQSRRAVVPEVLAASTLRDAFAAPWWAAAELKIVVDDRAQLRAEAFDARPGTVALVVGPEGGFSDRERAALHDAGAVSWCLGGRVLRAETASIAGIALLQHRFGDLVPGA